MPEPEPDPRARRLAALLADRYDFLKFLGQGGFAAVYQVRSRSLDRLEALKVLHATHEDDPEFAGRFQQEARVAASLDHPNIVRIHDFGAVEELFWYSMQFLDGPTLTNLAAGGPMDERRAASLLGPVCDALAYAHERGVVHRDVKPDNVIVGTSGRPVLMDFGIAKAEGALVKTQSGLILGSPTFLSPEQVKGEPTDGRTDVYALGVTLYLLVSGKRPFAATDRMEMMVARLRQDPIPLAQSRPGVDPAFGAIVMRCLAREKAGRPEAAALRDELLDFAVRTNTAVTAAIPLTPRALPPPLPVPPVPPIPAPRVDAPAHAPRRRVGLLAMLGVALVALSAVVWRFVPRRPDLPAVAPAVASPVPSPAPALVPSPVPVVAAPTAPTTVPLRVIERPTPHVARAASPTPREEPAPLVRSRPVVPAEVVEQVPVRLPPNIAAEYAGKSSTGIKVIVGEDGALRSAKVAIPVSPPCSQCDAAALEAVKRFRFTPAKDRDGNPVESTFGVAVPF